MCKSSKKIMIFSLLLACGAYLSYSKLYPFYVAATTRGTSAVYEPLNKKIESYYNKLFVRSSVYEFLRKAYYTFGIPKKGVIHIGARYAEELDIYQNFEISNVLWIEADPESKELLEKTVAKHQGSKVAYFAAADEEGTILLRKTSNDGHSSSILKLKKHLDHYPDITESKQIEVPKKRMDTYLSFEDKQAFNVIVLDIQGAELIALKGCVETLKTTDAVIAEVNYDELYEGAVLVRDLDDFMKSQGFTRADTISIAPYTGDALYIKDEFFKKKIS
ncbi:MAG TPA: FkbM family methyltransferase [Alphaproteobacteria bacterium]|nr:FkbM family methyltransferase [Alphaproteobacteria bacterium]